MKYKIKEFYEKALVEGKFNSEFFKDLRKISAKVQLKNFIEEKILPIAKEMGYDFSVEELLAYEIETVHKVNEPQLKNISGGITAKKLALGGIISLMTLGAGIAGTTSLTTAMYGENESEKELQGYLGSDEASSEESKDEESSPTAKVSTESDKMEIKKQINLAISEIEENFNRNVKFILDRTKKEKSILQFREFIEKWKAHFDKIIAESPESVSSEIIDMKRKFNDAFEEILPISRARRGKEGFSKKKDDLRKFMQSSHPYVAGLLNVASSITATPVKVAKSVVRGGSAKPGEPEEWVSEHSVKTPFGETLLKVIYKEKTDPSSQEKYFKVFERLIVTRKGAMTYNDIFQILDRLANDNKPITRTLLSEILNYLSLPTEEGDTDDTGIAKDILVRFNDRVTESKILSKLNPDQREAAASLSSILLLCESCETRSATGSKLERGFIRTVLEKVDMENPFANCSQRYTPSLSAYKNPPGGKEMTARVLQSHPKATSRMSLEAINSTVNAINGLNVSSDSDYSKKDGSGEEDEKDKD